MSDSDKPCFWTFEGCPEEEFNTTTENSGSGGDAAELVASGFDLTIVKDAMVNPVAGNLAFLTVATFITAISYMRLFRWRKTVDG